MRDYIIPWWKTQLAQQEIEAIGQAILKGHTTQGPIVEKLERSFAKLLGVPYALLTINGSAALLMALIASEVKAGDEVIVPNLTFIATAQAPLLLGAKIKLVDVESERPLLDIGKIKKAITRKTKAIIPVHLNGRSVDIKALMKLGDKYNVSIIEDAAQALCSRNDAGYLGVQAKIGIFSLAITKLITTVQGGLVVTKSKKLFKRLIAIRDYGLIRHSKVGFLRATAGFNLKSNDILASIGLSQLQKINQKKEVLKETYIFYKNSLKDLPYLKMIEVRIEEGELPLWVEVLCAEREKAISLLKDRHIQAKPFDAGLCYLLADQDAQKYQRSQKYSRFGLILPSGPDQSRDDLRYVVDTLQEIRNKISPKF